MSLKTATADQLASWMTDILSELMSRIGTPIVPRTPVAPWEVQPARPVIAPPIAPQIDPIQQKMAQIAEILAGIKNSVPAQPVGIPIEQPPAMLSGQSAPVVRPTLKTDPEAARFFAQTRPRADGIPPILGNGRSDGAAELNTGGL